MNSGNYAGSTPVGAFTWNHRPARLAFTCSYLKKNLHRYFHSLPIKKVADESLWSPHCSMMDLSSADKLKQTNYVLTYLIIMSDNTTDTSERCNTFCWPPQRRMSIFLSREKCAVMVCLFNTCPSSRGIGPIRPLHALLIPFL